MNRLCPCLLVPLLAIAACKTERKPLIGFDEPPPGSFILGPWNEGNAVRVWPIFSRAEIRFYDIAERDKAWEWINEGLLSTSGEPARGARWISA